MNGLKWNGKGYDTQTNIAYEIKEGKAFLKEFNYYGQILFEGEYLNGKKNGQGIYYIYDTKCIGEFKNDKPIGKRKDYYDGKLISKCEYLPGNMSRIKKYYDNGNLSFDGFFLYAFKRKGKKYYSSGKLRYEGEYLFDVQWNGKGYDENGNVMYEKINGTGKVKEYEEDHLVFEGEYLNGKRNGKGKEYDEDEGKLKFDGEYINGKKWSGIEYDEQGRTINVIENGTGCVKEYDDEGNLIFKGEYKNGEKNGKGKEYSMFGRLIFDGEYKNGKRNRKGIIFDNDIKIKGKFINGKLNGKVEEYSNNIYYLMVSLYPLAIAHSLF